MRYEREDFKLAHTARRMFYCPGCNASPDDWNLPSVGCPCSTHGKGSGAMTEEEVGRYLYGDGPGAMLAGDME